MKETVRKAVFPAAGLGTRFLPATKAQPKEMLPLVDKPIIQYGVEEALASGVDNIILVTGRGKNAIEDHFDVSVELETFLEARGKKRAARRDPQDLQPDQRLVRASGRAARARPRRPRHADARRRRALRRHPRRRRDRRASAGAAPDDRRVPGGGRPVLAIEEVPQRERQLPTGSSTRRKSRPGVYRIRDMVEKPPRDEAPSNLAIIGRYILTPDIFPALEETAKERIAPGKSS